MSSHAKNLLAKNILIGQRAAVIPAMRIFLVVVAALMFSAPWAHAGMSFAAERTGSSDVAVHCAHEVASVCEDTPDHHEAVDHHGAHEDQGPSCCSMSCHVGVQPCFGYTAFLALTKAAHVVRPAHDIVRAFVTSLDRPPRLA
nr:hypothetical protein [uncultured Devosia sp.]